MCLVLYLAAVAPFTCATITEGELFVALETEAVKKKHILAAAGLPFVREVVTHYNCCCPLLFASELYGEQTDEALEGKRKDDEIQRVMAGMVEKMVKSLTTDQNITMLVCWDSGDEPHEVDDAGVTSVASIRAPEFFDEPFNRRHRFSKIN